MAQWLRLHTCTTRAQIQSLVRELRPLGSCVRLFVTPWTEALQAPPSMGFSRQDYWSELPFPPPGDLLHPGIKPAFLALQVDFSPLSLLRSLKIPVWWDQTKKKKKGKTEKEKTKL